MDLHDNARTTPFSRALMVDRVTRQQQAVRAVAAAFGVSATTVRKWCARAAAEGPVGLEDRSARPHRSPRAAPASVVARMLELRRQRWTCAAIGRMLGVATATVARHLKRRGLSRLRALEPQPSRRGATNAKRRASSSTSTSRSSVRIRADRSPHHRRSARHSSSRCWLGVVARRHRRRLAGLPTSRSWGDERKSESAIAFLHRALALVPRVRYVEAHRS